MNVIEANDPLDVYFTDPQSDYVLSEAEYIAAVAGFGSGKTLGAMNKILMRKFQYPSIDQAYLAPTYGLIKKIFYPRVAEVLTKMGERFKINKTDHEINIQGYGKIICATMDDPDMIVGWECGDATMDEFDLLSTENGIKAMEKVSARCRQRFPDGKINQKQIVTTPEGFKATYQLFKKEPLPGSQLVQMSTYSNEKNLPPGYIPGLLAQYPKQLIKAYLKGEFVNLVAGAVYYAYDREKHRTYYVERPREALHIGMDFNVYKMAGIVHIIRDGIPYAVNELINLRDTPDMIDEIKDRFPEHHVTVYPDASGRGTSSKSCTLSDIKLLKDAGFVVKARKKNPLIKNRVASTNNAFEKNRYFINEDRCPQYAATREQQIWVNGRPDKDNDQDHPNDAGDYFINTMWPIRKPSFTTGTILGVTNAR